MYYCNIRDLSHDFLGTPRTFHSVKKQGLFYVLLLTSY